MTRGDTCTQGSITAVLSASGLDPTVTQGEAQHTLDILSPLFLVFPILLVFSSFLLLAHCPQGSFYTFACLTSSLPSCQHIFTSPVWPHKCQTLSPLGSVILTPISVSATDKAVSHRESPYGTREHIWQQNTAFPISSTENSA